MITTTKNKDLSYVAFGRGHTLISDVAPALGGTDLGFNPHELLEASLASCTSITIEMYARRKNWPLTNVKVVVSIVKEGTESLIKREIEFLGELSNDQKGRLLGIADKCPLHKLLTSSINIETKAL